MPDGLTLLVSALSAPPGLAGASKALLPHREIPGWAVQQMTGCTGDLSLLLVADTLCTEQSLTDTPLGTDRAFRDSSALFHELERLGRLRLFDGSQVCPGGQAAVDALVTHALASFRDWLIATSATARDWEAQNDLIGRVWDSTHGDQQNWRDMLRAAGMSLLKHNYRNQTQAVTALLTLIDWQPPEEMDPELLRDAFIAELSYAGCLILAASRHAEAVHDWSDLLPLYRRLFPADCPDPLVFRVPGISAADPEAVVEILTGDGARQVRGLVAAALHSGSRDAAEIERALLAAVPRQARAPYIFREISLHAFDPERLAEVGLPNPGPLLASHWRSAVE